MTNSPDNQDNMGSQLPMWRALGLTALLMVAWLLWSGLFKPLLLGLGAFSSVLTIFILYRMGYFGNETFAFRYGHRLIGFWAWLLKEIVKSALEVSQIVLRRELNVEPVTVTLDVENLESVDQALLGNSITLTPGTLTISLDFDWFWRVVFFNAGVWVFNLAARIHQWTGNTVDAVLGWLLGLCRRLLAKPDDHKRPGILARAWPIGVTAMWIAVLLTVYVLICYF